MLPQDIQQRANHKEEMLSLVNAERKAANDRKRIERELFDGLRRDKVDSIQKMQVGGWVVSEGGALAAWSCLSLYPITKLIALPYSFARCCL